MATLTFDTSGRVLALPGAPHAAPAYCWSDLDHFTQGYVVELFASMAGLPAFVRGIGWRRDCPKCVASRFCCDEHHRGLSFSDLAPETLAAILKDCAAFTADHPNWTGPLFWEERQNGFSRWIQSERGALAHRFPPLTAYMGDEGKVYLRAAA